MGNLHGWLTHFSAQSGKPNIMILVSSGIFLEEFRYQPPCEWTKHTLNTLVDGTEMYMVQVIAESHM